MQRAIGCGMLSFILWMSLEKTDLLSGFSQMPWKL